MGLGFHALQFLLHEHRHKPITGELLTIGKQAVPLEPQLVLAMIEEFGLPVRSRDFDYDEVNQHRTTTPLLTDKSLFAAFSDCRVSSADISPYEGADHVFDICGPLPENMRGRFDFIIDGGSLDNVFDPFRMLANMTEMLAPGGRMFIFAWSNSHPTAYAKVSPDWLMDYFAVNGFADAKVYPVEFPTLQKEKRVGEPHVTVHHYNPHVIYSGQVGYECSSITSEQPLQTYCIAEKGRDTTSGRTAVQKHYRGAAVEPYLSGMLRFMASPRPVFASPRSIDLPEAGISTYGTVRPVARWEEQARNHDYLRALESNTAAP